MPLSAHGLHRPVGDGLLTTLAFGKDHVCVAFLTISLTLVFVVANIVGGEIQVATTTTKTSGMPRPIQGSYTILKYILSGQKLIKNAKNCSFWRVFENLKLAVKRCFQSIGQKSTSLANFKHCPLSSTDLPSWKKGKIRNCSISAQVAVLYCLSSVRIAVKSLR